MSTLPYEVTEPLRFRKALDPELQACRACDGAGWLDDDRRWGQAPCESCDGGRYELCLFCETEPSLADTFDLICGPCVRAADTAEELGRAHSLALEEDVLRTLRRAHERRSERELVPGLRHDERCEVVHLQSTVAAMVAHIRQAQAYLAKGEARMADVYMSLAAGVVR